MYVWESLDACTAREIEKGDTDPKVYFNYQWLTFAKAVIWIKPPCLQEHHRRILGRMLDVQINALTPRYGSVMPRHDNFPLA